MDRWAKCEPGDAFQSQRVPLQRLSRELQDQIDFLQAEPDGTSADDQRLADLYTLIGCVRGAIASMANAQGVINQINWQEWATPRF